MIHIREATPADLGIVADLIRALAAYEKLTHELVWTEDELAEALFSPRAVPRVLLVECNGLVAGFAVWYPTFSTFHGRPGIWLEDLFVLPEFRGRGAGRALIEHVFQLAGDGRVEWAVLDWNTASIAFYESLGALPADGWTRYRWTGEPARAGEAPSPGGYESS